MTNHRHPFYALVLLFTGLGASACVAATDEEVDEVIVDDSEVGDLDSEAYRKPIRLPNSSCDYRRSDDPCGGFGDCYYWYLDVNDDQVSCGGDRICVCDDAP